MVPNKGSKCACMCCCDSDFARSYKEEPKLGTVTSLDNGSAGRENPGG